MNNKYSGPVHILRVAARTAFSLRPKANFLCFFFASAVLCLTDLGLGRMSLGVCLLGACDNSGLTACVLGILAGNLSFFGLRAAAAPCAVAAAVLCADDELRAFERKVGVSGGDVWAGIPRHPAVVNPPVRAGGTRFISLTGEWELIKRPHGAVAGRSLQEIQHGIRWGGQRNRWYASSGTDTRLLRG